MTLLFISSTAVVLIESNDTYADTDSGPERWDGFIENLGKDYDPKKGGGSWTPILSYDELKSISSGSSDNYYLKNNIMISQSDEPFTPIENFSGTFDGNEYVISGLKITGVTGTSGDVYAGFFSETGGGVVIRNLGLINSSVTASAETTGQDAYT